MAKVLIANDGTTHESMTHILTNMGHLVNEAVTGRDAITQMESCFPDLIICDLEMRDGDGLDVVASEGRKPAVLRTPILLLTGARDHVSLRRRMRERGINAEDITAVFSSPIDIELFRSSVGALLKKHRISRTAN